MLIPCQGNWTLQPDFANITDRKKIVYIRKTKSFKQEIEDV